MVTRQLSQLVIGCCVVVVSVVGARAQEAGSFDTLYETTVTLRQAGAPDAEIAATVAAWANANDASGLSLAAKSWLYRALDDDQIDPDRLSVRWTGSLTAPATANYVLAQRQQFHADGAMQVWVDEQLVLDTTDAVTVVAGTGIANPSEDDDRFQTSPIALVASEPVSLQVDYVFDEPTMARSREFDERLFPMAVLDWQPAGGEWTSIPQSAYRTPTGEAGGLRGEYFADTSWGQSVGERIDPGVQFTWYVGSPVFSANQDKQRELLDVIWPSVQQGVSTSVWSEADRAATRKDPFLEWHGVEMTDYALIVMFRMLPTLTVVEQRQVIEDLTNDEEGLARICPYHMRCLLARSFGALGDDELFNLIAAWSSVREPETSRPLPYPGHAYGTFLAFSYDRYGWVGHYLRGPRFSVSERLVEEQLVHEDGSCNLMIVYVTAFSSLFESKRIGLRERVDAQMETLPATGDVKASWMLARAYLEEVQRIGRPRPSAGVPLLEEAYFFAAESSAVKFRLLQELVARLIATNRMQVATDLISGATGNFTTPTQTEQLASWEAKAVELAAYYEAYAQQAEVDRIARQQQEYAAELRRRRELAVGRGDDQQVARFDEMLSRFEEE